MRRARKVSNVRGKVHFEQKQRLIVAPWCSGYHCCTTSFYKVLTQVLRRFKSCPRRVGDSRWRGSLTMVPAGNKAKRLSSVNHTTKTIYHHHHQQLLHLLKIECIVKAVP